MIFKKVLMKWGALAATVIDKIPFEKMLFREPDRSKQREELRDLVKSMNGKPAEPPEEAAPAEDVVINIPPPRKVKRSVTTHEAPDVTVDYQNREIAKLLLRMERHYAQKMRINGVPCDCGAPKHLLDLEGMAEETISMVDDPHIYYHIVAWVKDVGPASTEAAALSGQYEDKYPVYSHQARDLRKELMGSLDVSMLFPKKELPAPEPQPTPKAIEKDAIIEANEQAERTADQVKEGSGIVSVR